LAVRLLETAKVIEGYRAECEDRAEILEVGAAVLVVVADGAGGRPGGARAAEAVLDGVRQAAAAGFSGLDPWAWCKLLAEIDRAVSRDPAAGETTAVAATVTPAGLAGASVGDSAAWRVTAKGWYDLTRRQERKPFLGTGAARPVPFALGAWDGTLLVATDGLLKYTSAERIAEAARGPDLPRAAGQLVDLVRLRSGGLQDDVAVVLCRPSPPPTVQ
jgi:serine/threonine protein phosphatase PrpC